MVGQPVCQGDNQLSASSQQPVFVSLVIGAFHFSYLQVGEEIDLRKFNPSGGAMPRIQLSP